MMRLDKFLAHTGVGTRSEVKKLIKHGYVMINHELAFSPNQIINESNDHITFDGKTLIYEPFVYLMLNKPKGYLSATFDYKTPVVLDLIPEYAHRDLFPVGRLDIDTTGLLLITDDGDLGHRLTSPKNDVEKEYHATLDQDAPVSLIDKFLKGVVLDDGYRCLPAKLVILEPKRISLTIVEGKYHQVKRMFEAYGIQVTELERVRIAHLTLGNLALGQVRKLTPSELKLFSALK
jgi:16S rRNA pseudouridine516 synthase